MTQKVSVSMLASTGTLPALDGSALTGIDTISIENDIAVLALQNAVNSNITAHGLQTSWIEQFEDSNSITGLTNVNRDTSGEYVSSGSEATSTIFGPLSGSAVGSGWGGYHFRNLLQSHSATYSQLRATITTTGSAPVNNLGIGQRTGSFTDTVATPVEFLWSGSSASSVSGADQASDWLVFPMTNGIEYIVTGSMGSGSNAFYATTVPSGNSVGVRGNADYAWNLANAHDTAPGSTQSFYLMKMEGKGIVVNATGSFTSTTITPQDSASKSSLGLVILYKNSAGTNTLNTDVVAKVSANNGTTYSTCVLAAKGTFSTGINIAIAPAIAVTAGTQLKYKIEFANQVGGSKEAQINGVALQY